MPLIDMSLPHFFLDEQVIADEVGGTFVLRLAPDDAKHARVLRLAPGEHLAVVDAAHDYFECELVDFSEAALRVRVACRLNHESSSARVVLVQGLAKGDKMETVIRHATELGVAAFVPFAADRSIVKLDGKKASAKTQRWGAIAKSAAMQSGQRRVPEVCEPQSLSSLCSLLGDASAVLVCWEEAPHTARIADALAAGHTSSGAERTDAYVAVVVGPEGGLTKPEVEMLLACNSGASLVSLGSSILRTETAGIVAPALVLYELGGLGNAAHEGGEGVAR